MNNKNIIILAAILLGLAFIKDAKTQAPIAVSPLAQVRVTDVYNAKKYRNPFAAPRPKVKKAKAPKVVRKKLVKKLILNRPTLDSLRLTGIMLSGSEKQAILYDLNTRQTYFLISGKLYNRDIKEVKGFGGKVLSESVVLEKDKKTKTIALPSSAR
jgi:hypothetical protein